MFKVWRTRYGYLCVAEITLSDDMKEVRGGLDTNVSCCSIGKHILVLGRGSRYFSAALFDVSRNESGRRRRSEIKLTVKGEIDKLWDPLYLCQVAENRALLYTDDIWSAWCWCDVAGSTLTLRRCAFDPPDVEYLSTVPIRLPDGKLLVAGSHPHSTDITLINADGEPAVEKVGNIPGAAREGTSTVLIKDRFVVGFGGRYRNDYYSLLDDLWIFDLQTRWSSQVRKKGDWHPAASYVPLVVQDDTLYLVGGDATESINSLPLSTLADLIRDWRVKRAYYQVLGLKHAPFTAYTRRDTRSLPAFLL